jgi:hypothetical protein
MKHQELEKQRCKEHKDVNIRKVKSVRYASNTGCKGCKKSMEFKDVMNARIIGIQRRQEM